MQRPTSDIQWATDATYASGAEVGETTRLDPSGLRAQGILPNFRIGARFFNFLFGAIGDWINYLLGKSDHVFSPLNFDGVGDNVEDDTAAIQDCFDAATAAATGGELATVDLCGKSWRVTAQITAYGDVHVKNGAIYIDHASESLILWDSATLGTTEAIWENVRLEASQTNTGTLVQSDVPGNRIRFLRCRINEDGLCTNRTFYSNGGSDHYFEECYVEAALNNPGLRSNSGVLEIVGGKIVAPAGYADSLVMGSGGTHNLRGVHLRVAAATGGNATCYQMAGAVANLQGCHFDDGSGNNNQAIQSTLAANTGVLNESGSKFTNIRPFAVTNYLALPSSVEGAPQVVETSNAPGVTLKQGYRTISQRFTHTTGAPAVVTLDEPLFHGDRISLMLANSADAWSGDVSFVNAFYDDVDANLTDLGATDSARLFVELAAYRYEGSLDWYVTATKKVNLI
jgi:hypothetical protein